MKPAARRSVPGLPRPGPTRSGLGVGRRRGAVALVLARAWLALALAGLGLGGCAGASRAQEPPCAPPATADRPFWEAPPGMRADVRDLLARTPGASGPERLAIARDVAARGQAAVPVLVEGLRDRDPDVRGMSAWLLGLAQDRRTVLPLREALADPVKLVAYEAGSALLRLGDPAGAEVLVSGLEAPDPVIRAKCVLALSEHTGDAFGYRADDPPEERAPAVARWRAWSERLRTSRA